MSARHSIAFVLTVLCLMPTAAASDLVYRDAQAPAAQGSQNGNQLVLVTHESEIPATASQPKASLTSKFFRQNQQPAAAPTAKAVPTDRTRLMQPKRIAAGKPAAAPVGSSFKDRLRQLSSGEPVEKETPIVKQAEITAPPTVASSAAYTVEEAKTAAPALDNLVYLDDTAANDKKSKPEVLLTQVYSEELDQAFSAVPDPAKFEATAVHDDEAPVPLPMPEPEKIMFRPAVIDVSRNGQAVLRPNVLVSQPTPPAVPEGANPEELPAEPEAIVPEEWSTSIVDGTYTDYMATAEPRLGPMQALCGRVCARLQGPCGCEKGLGTERVMHAISFVDTTQPLKNFRMRFDAGYDWVSPDRAEYFWAQIGSRGPSAVPPAPAPNVDYQDIRTYMELGGDKFSVGTDVPIRLVDPDGGYANTSGLSDINITTKLLFLDGHHWQISNLFRTYIPSGDANRGLGTGHASIEPGFAMRYKYSDYTYFHGDLKYWIPLGGDPEFEGEVLNYGFAMSHVWRETDCFAVMPTIEFKGYAFLDGLQTESIPTIPQVVDVDPEGILIVHPGIRWAFDHGTDCSLREVGLFGGFAATSDSLYQELLRLEFRWSW